MPSKTPFGPETITIQRHTQYSMVATDGTLYRVNDPLTLLNFQDGATYQVKGSVSTKGNKYISEIVSGQTQAVAAPTPQPGLPPMPPVAQQIKAPPPPVVAAKPPAYKADNVEGKVACALGAGVVQYLASVSQTNDDFVAKYKDLMPKLIAYHLEKGWL